MSLPASSRPRRRPRVHRACAGLLLLFVLLAGGCNSLNVDDGTPSASGSPTTTQTPAREIIATRNL